MEFDLAIILAIFKESGKIPGHLIDYWSNGAAYFIPLSNWVERLSSPQLDMVSNIQ